jgi:hypothetical protein
MESEGGRDEGEYKYRTKSNMSADKLSPIKYAKSVTIPTLVAQVKEDVSTKESDVQTIYEGLSSKDKKLFWIQGTKRRFDGYNYFSENPGLMLEWYGSHFD